MLPHSVLHSVTSTSLTRVSVEGKGIPVCLSFFLVALHSLSYSAATQQSSQSTLSLELIHVDNLFRSPDATAESLLSLRLRRDAARHLQSPLSSGRSIGSGEYVTRLGIGTPAQRFHMVLDTGSNIIWLQSHPCGKCYHQVDPIFNPKNSTSFGDVECNSTLCHLLGDGSGCNEYNKCLYAASYGDGSLSIGHFSTETLAFGKAKVEKVAIGCGNYNKGTLEGFAGILGLGRGNLSFLSQFGSKFRNKFSYCLVNFSSSSRPSLIFGESAIPKEMVFTPMLSNSYPIVNSFYYVGLREISVGGRPVHGINASLFMIDPRTGDGGTIVDSGTVVTWLIKPAYEKLRDAFRQAVARKLTPAPAISILDTCFRMRGNEKVPKVVLHFDGGANMTLMAPNVLLQVDDNGTRCLAFASSGSSLSTIGNVQQQGFKMLFDLQSKRIGIAPNGC